MNGFADHGLDENAFAEKKGFSEGIRSFDAFRKILADVSVHYTLLPCLNAVSTHHIFCVSKALPADTTATQPKPNLPTPDGPLQAATRRCYSS